MIKTTFFTILLSLHLWGNGASLYTKCAECHGSHGQLKALGKSGVIKGQKASRIFNQLKSYAKGKQNLYGYGSLMKMQVALMTEKEMKEIAEYIAELK